MEMKNKWIHPVLNPLPEKVAGVQKPVISLSGKGWEMKRGITEEEIKCGRYMPEWREVTVPVQPELHPIEEKYAYRRYVTVPEDWNEKRIFLRFEGANGLARIYLNGKQIKTHYGGFVSWDCEITEFVRAGETFLITVLMEDKAGEISVFNYGGLVRDVLMYALPQTCLTRMHSDTVFDRDYMDAKLSVHLAVAGMIEAVRLTLTGEEGGAVSLGEIRQDEEGKAEFEVWVKKPKKWDCEHPNLYTLRAEVIRGGQTTETVSMRIGFRQIERRGREVFVNGDRIKLHGVNRHDTYPLTDRVVTHELVEQDIRLFKEANVNFIRTSHYPPRKDFLDLCDKYGIYVEDEASICFLGYASMQLQSDPQFKDQMMECFAEMIERDYSHPCILLWSLANECFWGTNFPQMIQYAHVVDHQRMTIFSFPAGQFEDDEQADVWSCHYASYSSDFASRQDGMGRTICMPAPVPVLHDESTHVPASESQGILREPGIHDFWGERLDLFWKKVWSTYGALGAAIWAGIDNTKKAGDALEGPPWGIVDGWRRKKPEFWHVRKAYSPVCLGKELEECEGKAAVSVGNRFLHTNLNEITIRWKTGQEQGNMSGPNISPFGAGLMILPIPYEKGRRIELTFTDPAGNQVDEAVFVVGGEQHFLPELDGRCPMVQYKEQEICVQGEDYQIRFSRKDGMITEGIWRGKKVVCGGPYLHMTGLHSAKWILAQMRVKEEENCVHIILEGAYGKVKVRFDIRMDNSGLMKTEYEFVDMPYSSPRRIAQTGSICEQCGGYDEVGIAYRVPKEADHFMWKRNGYWSVYPEWHIGRLQGNTTRHYSGGLNDDTAIPDREWRFDEKDTTLYGREDICDRGTRDFSSMKFHVYHAAIGTKEGMLQMYSDGRDSVRVWPLINSENMICNRHDSIRYTGNWFVSDIRNRGMDGTEMVSGTAGDSCEISFCGTGIQWYSSRDSICGMANLYLDGELVKTDLDLGLAEGIKNPRQYEKYYSRCIYTIKDLEKKRHTLKIEVTGKKAKDSFNSYVNIDHFVILEEDILGESMFIINQDYNYTRLSWGIYEKNAVCVDTGYKGSVYVRIGGCPDQMKKE